jgi:hypothetical protein
MMRQANTPKNGTGGHQSDIQTVGLGFIEVDHSAVNPSHHAHALSLYFILVNTLPRGCETENILPHIHDSAFITSWVEKKVRQTEECRSYQNYRKLTHK